MRQTQDEIIRHAITVGEIKRMLKALKVPDSAVIKSAKPNGGWLKIRSASFCRETGEISLW